MPDERLFRFLTDYARQLGAFLYGRRTYQLMADFWPTAGQDPSAPEHVGELGPELVPHTPRSPWTSCLVRATSTATSSRARRLLCSTEPSVLEKTTMGFARQTRANCGPTLAGSFMQRGLIDEYRLFVRPIVLGGGKPYFTALDRPISLRLAETRAFPGRKDAADPARFEGSASSRIARP